MKKKHEKNQPSKTQFQASEQTGSDRKLKTGESLIASLAHELKNPLNFIKNFAQLSEDDAQSLEEALSQQTKTRQIEQLFQNLRSNLNKITKHTHRADEMINDMLAQAQGDGQEFEPADLHPLLDESFALAHAAIKTQFPEFRIQVVTNYDPSIERIEMHAPRLGQAFLNIISNAGYALWQKTQTQSQENYVPTVLMETTDLEDHIQVRIHDNGIGISQEDLNQIFKPFFSTKTSHHGSGLGLSISHDIIVNEHGGKIIVNSQPGQFTEFTISLPKLQ